MISRVDFLSHPAVVEVWKRFRLKEEKFYQHAKIAVDDYLNRLNAQYNHECHRWLYFYPNDSRPKDIESALTKLWSDCEYKDRTPDSISATEVEASLRELTDWVGARVQVRFGDWIADTVKRIRTFFSVEPNCEGDLRKEYPDRDYTRTDQEGYRAYHMFVKLPVQVDIWGKQEKCLCEIQIRTLLQHVWAEVSHPMVYKPFRALDIEVPVDIKKQMKLLSSQLNAADQYFQIVRDYTRQSLSTAGQDASTSAIIKKWENEHRP